MREFIRQFPQRPSNVILNRTPRARPSAPVYYRPAQGILRRPVRCPKCRRAYVWVPSRGLYTGRQVAGESELRLTRPHASRAVSWAGDHAIAGLLA